MRTLVASDEPERPERPSSQTWPTINTFVTTATTIVWPQPVTLTLGTAVESCVWPRS